MSEVLRRDVAAYFQDLQAAVQPEPRKVQPVVVQPAAPKDEPSNALPDEYDLDAFARNASNLATGYQPRAVSLPDGSSEQASTWRDVACHALLWLGRHHKVPALPFRGGRSGHRYFLNTQPAHASEPMHEGFRKLQIDGIDVYVDLHRSAADILGKLREVCLVVEQPPTSFKVQFTKSK